MLPKRRPRSNPRRLSRPRPSDRPTPNPRDVYRPRGLVAFEFDDVRPADRATVGARPRDAALCAQAACHDAARRKDRLAEKRGRNYHQFQIVGPPERPPPEHLGPASLARCRNQGACVRQVSFRSLRMTPSGWLSSLLAGVILALEFCVPAVLMSVPRAENQSDHAFPDPASEGAESPEDVVKALGARSLCPARGRSSRPVPPDDGGMSKLPWTWTIAAANRSRLAWRSPATAGGLGEAGGRTPRLWIESQRC